MILLFSILHLTVLDFLLLCSLIPYSLSSLFSSAFSNPYLLYSKFSFLLVVEIDAEVRVVYFLAVTWAFCPLASRSIKHSGLLNISKELTWAPGVAKELIVRASKNLNVCGHILLHIDMCLFVSRIWNKHWTVPYHFFYKKNQSGPY